MVARTILVIGSLSLLLSSACKQSNSFLTDCFCDPAVVHENTRRVEGYSDQSSYTPDDEVKLFLHSNYTDLVIYLVHHTEKEDTLLNFEFNDAKPQAIPECGYKLGYNWEESFAFQLPNSIPSGYYSVDLNTVDTSFRIPLIIRPKKKSADILVIASYNTWQAYNPAGGASFYRYYLHHECEQTLSSFVHFQRPIYTFRGMPYQKGGFEGELNLTHWLEKENIPFDVITDPDFHNNPINPKDYPYLAIHCHGEYWSEKMYDHLEDYLNKGGNLLYLSGNGIYWKVTYDETGQQMECVKYGKNIHHHDSTLGGNWRSNGRPESAVLGTQYTPAGAGTYAPFMVVEPNHWLFEGIDVKKGDLFGKSIHGEWASGDETDKITPHSPENIVLLAEGLNKQRLTQLGEDDMDKNGGAYLTYYDHPGGGFVFSGSSITFTGGLHADSVIPKMLLNALNKGKLK
jgi:N,N-dimethylformamidase